MMKKGQAAMEFLMTYGWAILVVLAAIGALAYFGVLSPDRFLPEQCTLPSGVACLDFTATGSVITMRIQNSAGFDMQSVVVGLVEDDGDYVLCGTPAGSDNTLTDSESDNFACNGTFTSGKYKVAVNMTYLNAQTSMSHAKTGTLIAQIP